MVKLGSLFTGYGGLDLAAEQVFGARTVWTSDIDPGACKIIAHRMPDIPNLGDITAIDWTGVEPVDILTAGWPCQPFSHAGKRLGAADERALWPEVARAVRALRPRHVVLENVAAIASAGELARAIADLAALGYVGQWRCLRAADVGACHGRARIFILATDTNGPPRGWDQPWSIPPGPAEGAGPETGRRAGRDSDSYSRVGDFTGVVRNHDGPYCGMPTRPEVFDGMFCTCERALAADTLSSGCLGWSPEPVGRPIDGAVAAGRGEVNWGAYGPAIRRWERTLGRPAPAPTETSPRGTQRLSPAFVEWMQGLDPGWVTDVPGLGRNAQLKALGNGVVPQQAAAALRLMLDQLTAVA